MKKKFTTLAAATILTLITALPTIQAQGLQTFRMAEGFVRIAEAGQLADTLTVWGDINSPGRYIVPRGTKPHELIGYARGPIRRGGGSVELDWSKPRVEINVSSYNKENRLETVENYEFRYSDPYPAELRQYTLLNDQIISVEVKRRPTFRDYVGVVAPILTAANLTILIIDRIQR
jgi:hypothetical protein